VHAREADRLLGARWWRAKKGMRTMARGKWVQHAALLMLTMAPLPRGASAADPDSGLPLYVSAEFKRVAKRAFREILSYEIAQACAADASLCKTVVLRVSDALSAALDDDQQALTVALDGLFVDTSVSALLQATLGPLQREPPEPLRALMAPILRCLAGGLADKPLRASCTLDDKEWQAAVKNASATTFKGSDRAVVDQFISELRASHRTSPELALEVVAAIATVDGVERPDIRVYALRLGSFYGQGLEDGLFEAMLRFLAADLGPSSGDGYTAGVLVDYPKDPTRLSFWNPQKDDELRKAVTDCRQDPAPLEKWIEARNGGYLARLRSDALRGAALDLAPLEGLLRYDGSCGGEAGSAIRGLKRAVRYFEAPVVSYHALSRYGPMALAVCAVLDFVRTRDQARFQRDLERTFAYAMAQLGLKSVLSARLRGERAPPDGSGAALTAENMVWLGDALNGCELQVIRAALSIDLPAAPTHTSVPAGMCLSLATGKPVPVKPLTPRGPGASRTQWLEANGSELLRRLEPLLERARDAEIARGWGLDVDVEALRRAARYLSAGNEPAARKVMVRIGLDLLAGYVETYTAQIIGGSEQACIDDYRSRTIFSGVGAGCAAHLLVLGVYRPIVDFYWSDTEAKPGGPSDVAGTVYRSLLASPVLDYTPIILNVGLGANYVVGSRETWGRNGYGALTVLDKIGVAAYKRSGVSSQFETGLFAGGFLDALIRTAADSGKDKRYWLLGWTVGWPRLWGASIGFEAHAGAAMPFDLGASGKYGFACGASVVVPFTWVFEKGG
jgi:hypothetical protein